MVKKKSKFAGKVRSNAQKSKQSGAQYGYLNLPQGVSVYSAEPGGKAFLDIVPYVVSDARHPDRDDEIGIAVPGELWYKRPFRVHRNIGASSEAAVCLTSIGKKCPICEYRAQRMKDGAEKEETDALKTSLRNLYVVIPKKDKKKDDKPHIWDVSQYLFQNLLTDELEEDESYEVFPDLEEGLTLRIRFDSKTIGTSKPFAEASRIDFEERDYTYGEDMLAEFPDLDKVLNVLSYSQLERKFLEMEEDEAADPPPAVEDDDSPKEEPERKAKATAAVQRKAKPKAAAPPPPPPEEEDDDDETKCRACQGSGKSSKGGVCRACRGKGVPRGNEKTTAPASEERCPNGHRFGVDTEEHDECDNCDLWEECIDVKEGM